MKIIITFFLILLSHDMLSQESYKFTIMGNTLKNSSIELPDKSIFNMFDSKGAFTDNQGNIGDFFGQGVRKTNNKGILIDVNALVILKIDNKSSMWGFPRRAESDLEVGAGYFDVFSASGNLKELLGKRCQYGLTVTKEKSFVMQGFCK